MEIVLKSNRQDLEPLLKVLVARGVDYGFLNPS